MIGALLPPSFFFFFIGKEDIPVFFSPSPSPPFLFVFFPAEWLLRALWEAIFRAKARWPPSPFLPFFSPSPFAITGRHCTRTGKQRKTVAAVPFPLFLPSFLAPSHLFVGTQERLEFTVVGDAV